VYLFVVFYYYISLSYVNLAFVLLVEDQKQKCIFPSEYMLLDRCGVTAYFKQIKIRFSSRKMGQLEWDVLTTAGEKGWGKSQV
jgi:hypothetical protein